MRKWSWNFLFTSAKTWTVVRKKNVWQLGKFNGVSSYISSVVPNIYAQNRVISRDLKCSEFFCKLMEYNSLNWMSSQGVSYPTMFPRYDQYYVPRRFAGMSFFWNIPNGRNSNSAALDIFHFCKMFFQFFLRKVQWWPV